MGELPARLWQTWLDLGFSGLDAAALLFFLVIWSGYIWFADYSRYADQGISRSMRRYREQWMRVMLARENRIVDSQIMGNLLRSTTFLASTTILLLGGTMAFLGAGDRAMAVLTDLPFATSPARTVWELKVLVLGGVFIYAFFKFAWAMRLFNYGSILVGSAPAVDAPLAEKAAFVSRATEVNSIAAGHYNQGVRSYFFSVAVLSWFIHPAIFIVGAFWVVTVVYRREFGSHALKALRKEHNVPEENSR